MQVPVAVVLGMDRDAGVAQHRLRPGGGDRDELAVAAFDRIVQVPEMAVDLLLLHLEVGDRGLQLRSPN